MCPSSPVAAGRGIWLGVDAARAGVRGGAAPRDSHTSRLLLLLELLLLLLLLLLVLPRGRSAKLRRGGAHRGHVRLVHGLLLLGGSTGGATGRGERSGGAGPRPWRIRGGAMG